MCAITRQEERKSLDLSAARTNILFLKKNLQRKKISLPLQPNAEIAQLVEHDLAKVGVASSSLVFRSENRQAAERLPVLVSYCDGDGPTERPRSPRGAAFRQEGGGDVEAARLSEAQPRARVSFSAPRYENMPYSSLWGIFLFTISPKLGQKSQMFPLCYTCYLA